MEQRQRLRLLRQGRRNGEQPHDEQEVSALALHLLQASLVYVNTRMLQTVLAEPAWHGRLAPQDYRGLTPLIYAHVNPYGRFDLDLDSRIDVGKIAA
ncbi:Tn3 family transposase [Ensifer sp. YR511]|uniref:Tn3 family transposase n=1 Tax=Ensifer sp. YR511 TaxID=1855294 RepID=UPI00352D90D7